MVPGEVRELVSSQVIDRLPDQFTFKSITHKLRWVDQMARKTGGERYAESLQFFWFNEAHRRELYTPSFRRRLGTRRPDACVLKLFDHAPATDPIDRMMYVDVASRLPGQSLMILDRATMAYSLESRSPFLDPRFAEFMARVPASLKVRGSQLRYLERRLGERYLPREVLRRKKQGFASPLMYIMGEEVRRLAPRLLLSSELVRDGYLREERVATLVDEHLAGRRDHGNRIWLLLTAEIWYRHFISMRSVDELEYQLAERRSDPRPVFTRSVS
jgi:asparagine synthase (glutamine-hydrolysing)